MNLPADFSKRMSLQLGEEYDNFTAALSGVSPTSRRWNPAKIMPELATPVAWCRHAEYLAERPIFTLDPLLHAGAYYVQEASSMLIDFALRQVLDDNKSLRILDLCAAPGGKSTLLASFLNQNGILFSNEVIRTRVNILKENLAKWGHSNVVVTNHEAEDFASLEGFFDVIVIDAPCSGEGLFRKDANAMSEWSLDNVSLCSARQKKIVAHAEKCLRSGGILLYSTCTYNADENILNTKWIVENFDFESVEIKNTNDFGVVTVEENNVFGYQCFPHKVKGEGFYFAVLRKKETSESNFFSPKKFKNLEKITKKQEDIIAPFLKKNLDISLFLKKNGSIVAIPNDMITDAMAAEYHLQRLGIGTEIGEIKGNDFVPSHELALSLLAADMIQSVELSLDEALTFLRKDVFDIDTNKKGWTLMQYQGQNLGWAKLLPNRMNNYYPQEWKIRMR